MRIEKQKVNDAESFDIIDPFNNENSCIEHYIF